MGRSPHPLKTNCILKALDCLKFVAKIKQVTFFPWLFCLILFNFWYLLEFAFSLYLVHAIFTAGLFYKLSFAFSWFPLLSCLSKIPAKRSETPYKTWDTQNVSVYLDKWHGSNFNHANIRKGAGHIWLYCIVLMFYMSCTLNSFTNWPGLSRSTSAAAIHGRIGTEKQGWLYA